MPLLIETKKVERGQLNNPGEYYFYTVDGKEYLEICCMCPMRFHTIPLTPNDRYYNTWDVVSKDPPNIKPSYKCTYAWGEDHTQVLCHFYVHGTLQLLDDCSYLPKH